MTATFRYDTKIESYPDLVKTALREMRRQFGPLVLNGKGIAVRGLFVRDLVLPGGMAGTAEIRKSLAEEISKDTYVNVMS